MARTFRAYSARFYFVEWSPDSLWRQMHRHWGDKGACKRNAPRTFRKMLDRRKDAQDKQSLHNALVNDTELLIHPRLNDANWEYW